MSNNSNQNVNPFGRLLFALLMLWAVVTYPPDYYADPLYYFGWWAGAFCAASGLIQSVPYLLKSIGSGFKYLRIFRRDDSRGSAGWMTEKEIRRVGLHRRRKGRRFIGIVGATAIWLKTETHHLVLGPSGTAKTTSAIMNFLMGCSESALITDIKGELWETTRAHREKKFGHRCVKIDPKNPDESVQINPLVPASAKLKNDDPAALTYVRGMALQLLPDPQGGGGSNDVFYKGARNLIVTVVFAVLVVLPPEHRNLAMVYRALSDLDILHDLLEAAEKSPALNGEIADMARSAHQSAFGDGGNAKTFESFRMNALLALEAFGPGNYLAKITSETNFEFSELKTAKTSLYILIDYSNSAVLGKFSGLLQFMASDAMVAAGNNKPVLFILDEFCNAPLHTLPTIMTLLRSAGVRCILATQDFDDITRVYSKHALETVLSETHIKQILGGIRSKSTLEYLSSYLGEYTEMTRSYAMGGDGPQESISYTNRRLLTEEEIRTLPDDAQIVIYGSHKPVLAKKVQVFAVAPWRKTLGVSTNHGSKRKLLPVEARLRWWGTEVSPRGARLARKMAKKVVRKSARRGVIAGQLLSLLRPGTPLIIAGIFAATVFTVGLPNLRWEYGYRGSAQQTPISYVWCRYLGPTSPGVLSGPQCPLILWRKTW